MSDLQHKGNAVTIMGKMKARNGENAIIIWDGTGDVNLTANDEEFFMFVMVRSIKVMFAHISIRKTATWSQKAMPPPTTKLTFEKLQNLKTPTTTLWLVAFVVSKIHELYLEASSKDMPFDGQVVRCHLWTVEYTIS